MWRRHSAETAMTLRPHVPLAWLALTVGVMLAGCGTSPHSTQPSSAEPVQVRNVIFMMSDGTPHEAWALTRWVKGGRLASDHILSGAVQTYGADSVITDSAPGATAFATGHKGTDKGISVGAWRVTIAGVEANAEKAYVPLPTVLEGARLTGRATGLVVTANVQHASPAAFSAHTHHRERYTDIAKQQVYQGMDVVLGGGEQYLLPKVDGRGVRPDGQNLVSVLTHKGYSHVRTRAELMAAKAARLFGTFSPDEMVYDLDRAELAPDQPSLAEMTRKAIETLSRSEKGQRKGFFLFVEGSKVDWAAHANDPSGIVSDLAAYDEAVKVALDFAKADGHTLLISTSDHGNGGLSIGRRELPDYATTDDDGLVGPLRRATLTGEGLARLLATDKSERRIREVFERHWGITDLSAQEIQSIQTAPPEGWLQYVLGPIQSSRAGVGWTSNGHTGGDTLLFSFGPGRVSGLWQNTALAHHMAQHMGFTLPPLQDRLFVDVVAALSGLNLQLELDQSQAAAVLKVRNARGDEALLAIDTNQLVIAGQVHELEGIVVLAHPTGKVYAPQQAIGLIRAKLAP